MKSSQVVCVPTEFPTCENISPCSLALGPPSPPLMQHMLQSLQITEMDTSKPWLLSPLTNNIQQVWWCQDRLSSHKASFRQPPHPHPSTRASPPRMKMQTVSPINQSGTTQWVPVQLGGCCQVWRTPNPPPFTVPIAKI